MIKEWVITLFKWEDVYNNPNYCVWVFEQTIGPFKHETECHAYISKLFPNGAAEQNYLCRINKLQEPNWDNTRQEKLNKLATELGNSIYENEPNLNPGDLTITKVRAYAEGLFDYLSSKDLEELIFLTYNAEHIVYDPHQKQ